MASQSKTDIFDVACHKDLLSQFVSIHQACVEQDHQLLTFLHVSGEQHESKLRRFWEGQFESVRRGEKVIIVQTAQAETQLLGFVILYMPFSETGPFRAYVLCLMVSPHHRRQGIAKRVMEKLEHVARERDRGLLMLDTTIGSGADRAGVYQKMGYTEYGCIPRYGIHPGDGHLADERFFYKDLRP